jgi:hypothetical protein
MEILQWAIIGVDLVVLGIVIVTCIFLVLLGLHFWVVLESIKELLAVGFVADVRQFLMVMVDKAQ